MPSSLLSSSSLDDDYYYSGTPQLPASSPQQQRRQHLTQPQSPPSFHDAYHESSTTKSTSLGHRYDLSIDSTRSASPTSGIRRAPLNPISAPSFATFRSQLPDSASLKRPHFPLLQQRSPRSASFSSSEKASPRLAAFDQRPSSIAAPPRQLSSLATTEYPPEESEEQLPGDRSVQRGVHGLAPNRQLTRTRTSYTLPTSHHNTHSSIDSRIVSTKPSSRYSSPRQPSTPVRAKYAHERFVSHASQQSNSSIDIREGPTKHRHQHHGSMTAEQQAPVMTVQFDGIQRSLSEDSIGADSVTSSGGQRPKSPGGRLGSFFGWKGAPQKGESDHSPTTTFSDRSLSPMPSPRLMKASPMDGHTAPARLTPPGLDIQKANSAGQYFDNPETPLLLGDQGTSIHVKELERELSHISQELAMSIRREMELEDELERLRSEYPTAPPSELGRRNSDYFSDSGASSTRFPITDVDAKVEQLEGQLRRIEQDKANLQMDVASRIQTELGRRRDLEELVRHLEDQLEKRSAEGDESSRVEQLETSLDETRKRLGQEKESKQSFEELYIATREELEHYRNERDNLRDEVVPQLRARIEGLEAQAADTQALMYENTRIQQEHGVSRGLGHARMGSVADSFDEDGDRISALGGARTSASRASSLVKGSGLRRGNSVKERSEGTRQRSGSGSAQNGDAFKEIEDQRDALHKALQLLIRRYDRSQREHARAIKKISVANSAPDFTMASRKSPFSKEVAFLKEEVTTLRKRTEDALEQKWQYEKGLSGLKMDLDRAEQETRGLRILLQDNDAGSSGFNFSSGSDDGEADNADAKLKLSISTAEQERDQVRQVAQEYRQRASQTAGDAAAQLLESAKRMDDLADQLENQVQSHIQLRDRLSQAVAKGEREQRESTRQIEDMQKRLAGMEDSVLAAQQHSENTLADHDAEVRRIEDATSPRLQRLNLDLLLPPSAGTHKKLSVASPSVGSSSPLMLKKSPKLGAKLSDASLLEASRTQMLERKVKELEGLLKEAEDDMQMVVQRVNRSQLEVNELQMERDSTFAQMRKLQALVVAEREKAESLMR